MKKSPEERAPATRAGYEEGMDTRDKKVCRTSSHGFTDDTVTGGSEQPRKMPLPLRAADTWRSIHLSLQLLKRSEGCFPPRDTKGPFGR